MFSFPLDSLTISGYRCFDNLSVGEMGRVNLIVGKNNVGKTAFLEAIWIYASWDVHRAIEEILISREENVSYVIYGGNKKPAIRHVFSGRDDLEKEIKIGSSRNFQNAIVVAFRNGRLQTSTPKILAPASVDFSNGQETDNNRERRLTSFFVGITGLRDFEADRLWEKVELTPLEDKILEAIRLIVPNIKKVRPRLVDQSNTKISKVIYAQIDDSEEPLPLKSFGEGLNRLFEIALVLVSCKDGILLIDEIENGLHYSVLPDVWKLIFHTAKELNVQVFATTHSRDCVEAFAQAADESPDEGMLIRLENHDGKIVAKTIEEDMLVDAVNYEVEVR